GGGKRSFGFGGGEMDEDTLRAAYEATEYRVTDSRVGPLVIRIGEVNEALDRLLGINGAARWAYLTACNPRSMILQEDENRQRTEALREQFARFTTCRGEGVGADGHPPEASFVVLGIEEAEAEDVGARFEQNAVVVGRRGEPARLLWVSRRQGEGAYDGGHRQGCPAPVRVGAGVGGAPRRGRQLRPGPLPPP